MIKPGALHRANGGFLVVQALDVLTQPLVWETLKRALRTRQVRLENMGEQFSIIPTTTLSPEPIPLDVKVAMIGTPRIFQILQTSRRRLPQALQGEGRLHDDVERTDEHSMLYARFIARQVKALGMRPFDRAPSRGSSSSPRAWFRTRRSSRCG